MKELVWSESDDCWKCECSKKWELGESSFYKFLTFSKGKEIKAEQAKPEKTTKPMGDVEVRQDNEKVPAKIYWKGPIEVVWTPGGFVFGKKHESATTNPSKLPINYTPEKQGPLTVGECNITASLPEEYGAEPVTVLLKVKKAPATIKWREAIAVEWKRGGFVLGDEQLNATTVPPDLNIIYKPSKDGPLSPGEYSISASLDAKQPYEAPLVRAKFIVNKAKAEIICKAGPPEPWEGELPEKITSDHLSDDLIPANTLPSAIDWKYEVIGDLKRNALRGKLKVKVSLDDSETEWEARSVTLELDFTFTEEQISAAKHKKKVEKTSESKKSEKPLTEEQRKEAAEKEKKAKALAKTAVPKEILSAEYPVGAANVVPHIHNYGGGLHLKIAVNNKVKRLNLVQDGIRYKSVPDTLATAWQYDLQNGTRIKKVLEELLEQF